MLTYHTLNSLLPLFNLYYKLQNQVKNKSALYVSDKPVWIQHLCKTEKQRKNKPFKLPLLDKVNLTTFIGRFEYFISKYGKVCIFSFMKRQKAGKMFKTKFAFHKQ